MPRISGSQRSIFWDKATRRRERDLSSRSAFAIAQGRTYVYVMLSNLIYSTECFTWSLCKFTTVTFSHVTLRRFTGRTIFHCREANKKYAICCTTCAGHKPLSDGAIFVLNPNRRFNAHSIRLWAFLCLSYVRRLLTNSQPISVTHQDTESERLKTKWSTCYV